MRHNRDRGEPMPIETFEKCLAAAAILGFLVFVFGALIPGCKSPTIGATHYSVSDSDNPFLAPVTNSATVLDVRNGYVLYVTHYGKTNSDPVQIFNLHYPKK